MESVGEVGVRSKMRGELWILNPLHTQRGKAPRYKSPGALRVESGVHLALVGSVRRQ